MNFSGFGCFGDNGAMLVTCWLIWWPAGLGIPCVQQPVQQLWGCNHLGTWKDHDIVVRTSESKIGLWMAILVRNQIRIEPYWTLEPPKTLRFWHLRGPGNIGDLQWCSEEKTQKSLVQQPLSACLRRRRKTPEPSKYFTRGGLKWWNVQSQRWFQDVPKIIDGTNCYL